MPADFAQRGLTGKMLAGQLVDRLAQMQDTTDSARPAASYRNNWGGDLKVQIPDAGISIGEFESYLREWLGHLFERTDLGPSAASPKVGNNRILR